MVLAVISFEQLQSLQNYNIRLNTTFLCST